MECKRSAVIKIALGILHSTALLFSFFSCWQPTHPRVVATQHTGLNCMLIISHAS